MSPLTYEVVMPDRNKPKQQFHVNLLKEWLPPAESLNTTFTMQDEYCSRSMQPGLTVNLRKCALAKTKAKHLGYVLGNRVIWPQVVKVEASWTCPSPTTMKKVRSFLGFVGRYHHLIPNFSARAAVLTNLTKKSKSNKIMWKEACERAFNDLKRALFQDALLESRL